MAAGHEMGIGIARDWYAVLLGLRTDATEHQQTSALAAARRLTEQARYTLNGPTPVEVDGLVQSVLNAIAVANDHEAVACDLGPRPVHLAVVKEQIL